MSLRMLQHAQPDKALKSLETMSYIDYIEEQLMTCENTDEILLFLDERLMFLKNILLDKLQIEVMEKDMFCCHERLEALKNAALKRLRNVLLAAIRMEKKDILFCYMDGYYYVHQSFHLIRKILGFESMFDGSADYCELRV